MTRSRTATTVCSATSALATAVTTSPMLALPEAALAAEAGLAYANVSVVTDFDSGVQGVEPVTHAAVLERFEQSSEILKQGIMSLIPVLAAADLGSA